MLTTTLHAEDKAILIIHGGAGVRSPEALKKAGETREQIEEGLAKSLLAGWKAMQKGTSADGVEAAIRVMEDSPLFNAGKGAVLTSDGRAELDAAMMDGSAEGTGDGKVNAKRRGGAITGVAHVKNPISAARAVMEMEGSRHVLLAGQGAEDFVLNEANRRKYAIERVENHYFWTDRRLKQIRQPEAEDVRHDPEFVAGTVGAVAVKDGRIVAGTSTGGLANKWPGRVGDTPLLGSGTWADDRACGVSGTGTGELFIRSAVAHDVAARMLYKKIDVKQAAKEAVDEMPDQKGGAGGVIALDAAGNFAFPVSERCPGMSRGYVTEKGEVYVAIYAKDEWKKIEVK
jgi:beta-aspartyl-peptidase (threonine type)